MLRKWTKHNEYQETLVSRIARLIQTEPEKVKYYAKHLAKIYEANLDSLLDTIAFTYPNFGRPAQKQDVIFRSFLLASSLGFNSIRKWVPFLKSEKLLCYAAGAEPSEIPAVSNHYDFIKRLWLGQPPTAGVMRSPIRKPRKKLGKNQKQEPKHPGIIARLVQYATKGRIFSHRPERLLQQVFASCCVIPSAVRGLLGNITKLDIAADGTSLKTGAGQFGKKVCDCQSKGILNCNCRRKYSDAEANWGWDSHNEKWFFGFTEYMISVRNTDAKVDLPIYLRTVQASRFDGVTAIVALSELRQLYPQFSFHSFIADCAHDNYPTYELLNAWNINPVISLSKNSIPPVPRNTLQLDSNGTPVCKAGRKLFFWGTIKSQHRLKWRCPIKCLKRQSPCHFHDRCNSSAYGLTCYTKPDDDLRYITPIPRGTHTWRLLFNKRTAAERVNDKLLIDYTLESSHTRGKMRFSFWALIHSFNMHLDAWLKHLPHEHSPLSFLFAV